MSNWSNCRQLMILLMLGLLESSHSTAAGPFQYYALTPCRMVDTRGPNAPALVAGVPRSFTVRNTCGIPGNAQAVAVNLTVIGPNASTWLVAWQQGTSQPPTSNINFVAGQTSTANGAILSLSTDPTYQITVLSQATTDLIIDVTGYYQ